MTADAITEANVRVDLRLRWGSLSDVGKVRATNQDACHADPRLFIVADGLGGPGNGEVASALAVQAMVERAPTSHDDLIGAVEHANYVIHATAIEDTQLMGMCTTVCALAIVDTASGHRLGLVNVGDSRVYRHRGQDLEQLTLDHSRVAEMVRLGLLEPEEAETHVARNTLTRAVGVLPEVTVDDWVLDIKGGDRYLLCSDGITNMMSDEEIAAVLSNVSSANAAAEQLVRTANANGGIDNSTAMVVDVHITRTTTDTRGDTVVHTESPSATNAAADTASVSRRRRGRFRFRQTLRP